MRLLRGTGHGIAVLGAAIGIETLAAALIPGLVRFAPLGMRFLQVRTGGVLGGALILVGALLVSASGRS